MFKELQRLYPGEDVGLADHDAAQGLEFDEVRTEHADLMDEREQLQKDHDALDEELNRYCEESQANGTHGSEAYAAHVKEIYDKWEAVDDRLYDVKEALNVYPTPKRTKRLIRTSLLKRPNS